MRKIFISFSLVAIMMLLFCSIAYADEKPFPSPSGFPYYVFVKRPDTGYCQITYFKDISTVKWHWIDKDKISGYPVVNDSGYIGYGSDTMQQYYYYPVNGVWLRNYYSFSSIGGENLTMETNFNLADESGNIVFFCRMAHPIQALPGLLSPVVRVLVVVGILVICLVVLIPRLITWVPRLFLG